MISCSACFSLYFGINSERKEEKVQKIDIYMNCRLQKQYIISRTIVGSPRVASVEMKSRSKNETCTQIIGENNPENSMCSSERKIMFYIKSKLYVVLYCIYAREQRWSENVRFHIFAEIFIGHFFPFRENVVKYKILRFAKNPNCI